MHPGTPGPFRPFARPRPRHPANRTELDPAFPGGRRKSIPPPSPPESRRSSWFGHPWGIVQRASPCARVRSVAQACGGCHPDSVTHVSTHMCVEFIARACRLCVAERMPRYPQPGGPAMLRTVGFTSARRILTGIAHRSLFSTFLSAPASSDRPLAVRRYFWRRLRGLSGMVRSIKPAFKAGRK